MNSGTLGFTSPQQMIFSVTPCCKAARQRWEGRQYCSRIFAGWVCAWTLIDTQINWIFLSITLLCLLGCLEFFQAQLTKAWRKDLKHHGRKKFIYLLKTRMVFWSVTRYPGEGARSWWGGSEPRAGTQPPAEMPGSCYCSNCGGEYE